MSAVTERSAFEEPEQFIGLQSNVMPDGPSTLDELFLQPVPAYIGRHLEDLATPTIAAIQHELFKVRTNQVEKMARWATVRRGATERLFREFEMLSSDTSSALFKRVFEATEQEVATSKQEDFDNLRTRYREHPVILTFEKLRTKSQNKLVKLTAITMQRTAYLLIDRHTPND